MHPDHRLHFDDAGGDLDEAQAQGVELGDAPRRALRHRDAKPPHQPIGAGVEEETELIGRRLGAGRAVRRQMRLPGLDVVFGLAASAIKVFVEAARVALPEIGDDEAGVGAFSPTSTRAMIRSTRLQLCAPSKNSLKRRSLPSRGAHPDATLWSARRRGCSRGRWRDTNREPRGHNNGYRRATASRCGASERG